MTRRHWPELIYLGDKPLLCRLGWHSWSGWQRLYSREYEAVPGSEGVVVVTLFEERMCYRCLDGRGVRHVMSVVRLTPLEAIGGGLITERERKDLRKVSMPDMDLGGWQDMEDGADGDRWHLPAECNTIGLRCRFGLHTFKRHRCARCRKLSQHYRRWPVS